jgi:transcriptional regulator with XRE-family HTH domain
VARQSGYAKSYVADIEKGRKNPTIDAVEAVGKVVGLAPAVLWASVASITGIIPMTAEERLDHIMHVADMGLRS